MSEKFVRNELDKLFNQRPRVIVEGKDGGPSAVLQFRPIATKDGRITSMLELYIIDKTQVVVNTSGNNTKKGTIPISWMNPDQIEQLATKMFRFASSMRMLQEICNDMREKGGEKAEKEEKKPETADEFLRD